MMTRSHPYILAVLTAVSAVPEAFAAPSPAFQQAILAELAPATRAEVQRRATAGTSVYEILAVALLNNLQVANASLAEVVAVDFGREIAVVKVGSELSVVSFDSATLAVRN